MMLRETCDVTSDKSPRIIGSIGAEKTTVLAEASDLLTASNLAHAAIDLVIMWSCVRWEAATREVRGCGTMLWSRLDVAGRPRMTDLGGYESRACEKCGGTRWRKLTVPVFRVEECLTCHANRTTTDLGAGVNHVPVSVVYIVTEYWGILRTVGDIVAVFASESAAEQEAERRRAAGRGPAGVQYLVKSYEGLGDAK